MLGKYPSLKTAKKKKPAELLQFKQQEQKFHILDEKMDKVLSKHEAMGTLKRIVTNDSVQSLMLSSLVKRKYLLEFISKKRKEYLLNQNTEFKNFITKRQQITMKDAMEMLSLEDTKDYALRRHDMAGSLTLIRAKLRVPFHLYTGVILQQTRSSMRRSSIMNRRDSIENLKPHSRRNAAVGVNKLASINDQGQRKQSLSYSSADDIAAAVVAAAKLNKGPSIEEQIKALIIQLHKQNDTFSKHYKTLYANFDVVPPPHLLQRNSSTSSQGKIGISSSQQRRSSSVQIEGHTCQ